MSKENIEAFAQRAEAIYATQLRSLLEPEHIDEFVAIEPESGDYFLGKTLNEAAQAARRRHPERRTHLMRVGHSAALHFGMRIP